MQAAIMNPVALNEAGVDQTVDKEIEIAKDQLTRRKTLKR
jgi:elongation factor Ts